MAHDPHLIRPFEFERDNEYVDRILLEVGWRRPQEPDVRREAREAFHRASDAYVAELSGEPECFVSTVHGDYRYRDHDLPFTGVTGVVTSRVARKQGLASATTVRALAAAAERGSVIAGLGIFDQGFYDKLGFGTGGYDHYLKIDPATLTVPYCTRVPVRLTPLNVPEMHEARLRRRRTHGSVRLSPEAVTRFNSTHSATDFGLGFRDEAGTLTHHLWVHTQDSRIGPYRILWTAFSTIAEYLDLLGLMRNLGDQLYMVYVPEPAGVQLQDFIRRPFRRYQEARRGEFETDSKASANFQYRILDVAQAFQAAAGVMRLPAFTMRVTDPVSPFLHDHDGWQGVAGDYEVGPHGAARIAAGVGQPDLTLPVSDLTRGWLGVLPFSTLRDMGGAALSGDLARELDAAFAGPSPHTDWFY